MSLRNRIRYSSKLKTDSSILNKPFEESISLIIIQKCHKIQLEIQKKSKKQLVNDIQVKSLFKSLSKDTLLITKKNPNYSRMMSLVCNTKANYYHKIDDCVTALGFVDDALEYEKTGHVDVIDTARTLLNKSVILGQLARTENREEAESNENLEKTQKTDKVNNLYSHEAAINLAKQALEIIKNRGTGSKKSDYQMNEEYKLGQIIIISFHNIATELVYLKNQKEAYNLYKKAYDLAIRILGHRHSLTKHLKTIISEYKDKNNKQRNKNEISIDECSISKERKEKTKPKLNKKKVGENSHTQKVGNFEEMSQNSRYKSFFKIYNYNSEGPKGKSRNGSFRTFATHVNEENSQDQMKDLKLIQRLYQRNSKSHRFPEIRKNAKDIIKQGKTLSESKPAYLKTQPHKQQKLEQNKQNDKLEKIEVKQIDNRKQQKKEQKKEENRQQKPNKKDFEDRRQEEQEEAQDKQDKNCQLI